MTQTIGDLGEIYDGPHATPSRVDSGPYFLNIASLDSGRLDLSLSDHVSERDFEVWTRRVLPLEDDLLFSYETRLGEAALMPAGISACLGRRMALIRPNRSIVDPRFLLYFYISPGFKRVIDEHTIHGATVNRIPISTMSQWPIAIPPLDHQRAIAEVLGALDDKIAANTKLARTADELALALCSMTRGTVKVAEISDHRRSTIEPQAITNQLVAHFSLPAFDTGKLPEEIDPREIKSLKFTIESPCVLISKLNPRFPRVWDLAQIPARLGIASTEFLVLVPTVCSTSTLAALLSQPDVSSTLQGKARGTSGSHQRIKPADLLETAIGDPESLSDGTDEWVRNLGLVSLGARQQSDVLRTTRDALLPQLMSGRLRVKDAEAVAESVL